MNVFPKSAVRELPAGYRPVGRFDIRDTRRLLLLNVLGLGLLAASGWAFTRLLLALRPADGAAALSVSIDGFGGLISSVAALIGSLIVMVVLHEGAHGIFFWLFTHQPPAFSFKWTHAYAAAPGWFFPRGQYLLTALAPAVLVSLLGVGLMLILPVGWLFPLVLMLVFNFSGAVADFWVAVWLLRQPAGVLALDEGDAVMLFLPDAG